MISTLSMSHYSGLPVNLPKSRNRAATARRERRGDHGADGKITIDQQEVSGERVGDILKARLAGNPELLVLINADERVEHGLVIEVMDQVRQAGVAKMAIAVKPKENAVRAVRNDSLGIPILYSLAIHILVMLAASVITHSDHPRRRDFLPIGLVDLPRPETPLPDKIQAPPEIKKSVPPTKSRFEPAQRDGQHVPAEFTYIYRFRLQR